MRETFDDLRLDRVEAELQDMRSGYVHRKCIPWAIVVQPVIGAYIASGPERSVRIASGEVCLVAAGVPIAFDHRGDRAGRMRSRWLHIQASYRGVLDPCALHRTPSRIAGAAGARIGALFDELLPIADGGVTARVRRLALAAHILAEALAATAADPRADDLVAGAARLAPLTAWAKANLHRPLTIADLARAAGMSRSRLHAHCRRWLHRAPMAWLKELRLAEAAHRLLVGDDRVAAVAEATGFANPFHFSREFTRRYGLPPRGYRDGQRLGGA
ncbi:MAG TPA: AraC family transcriptional regulator [Planctomycetota bacterium]|nr:AraC family transcriptional regulator [Planctomycetota bacterium]